MSSKTRKAYVPRLPTIREETARNIHREMNPPIRQVVSQPVIPMPIDYNSKVASSNTSGSYRGGRRTKKTTLRKHRKQRKQRK